MQHRTILSSLRFGIHTPFDTDYHRWRMTSCWVTRKNTSSLNTSQHYSPLNIWPETINVWDPSEMGTVSDPIRTNGSPRVGGHCSRGTAWDKCQKMSKEPDQQEEISGRLPWCLAYPIWSLIEKRQHRDDGDPWMVMENQQKLLHNVTHGHTAIGRSTVCVKIGTAVSGFPHSWNLKDAWRRVEIPADSSSWWLVINVALSKKCTPGWSKFQAFHETNRWCT